MSQKWGKRDDAETCEMNFLAICLLLRCLRQLLIPVNLKKVFQHFLNDLFELGRLDGLNSEFPSIIIVPPLSFLKKTLHSSSDISKM